MGCFLTSTTVGLFSAKAGCFVIVGRVLRSISLPSLSPGKLEFILRKAYVGSSCVRFGVRVRVKAWRDRLELGFGARIRVFRVMG